MISLPTPSFPLFCLNLKNPASCVGHAVIMQIDGVTPVRPLPPRSPFVISLGGYDSNAKLERRLSFLPYSAEPPRHQGLCRLTKTLLDIFLAKSATAERILTNSFIDTLDFKAYLCINIFYLGWSPMDALSLSVSLYLSDCLYPSVCFRAHMHSNTNAHTHKKKDLPT